MDEKPEVVDHSQKSLSMDHLVQIEVADDGTAVVILNRPQKRNALSAALIADLNAALQALERDDSVRAILLTGPAGGPFSGGCHFSVGQPCAHAVCLQQRVRILGSSSGSPHQRPIGSSIWGRSRMESCKSRSH